MEMNTLKIRVNINRGKRKDTIKNNHKKKRKSARTYIERKRIIVNMIDKFCNGVVFVPD